ncbi:MAG: exodeoxyribonuclease V subunit gamma [Spirochaetaceae bacterium]|nr:exodeoxyribonuclease V subunit gamma [Spirochaetaceae bacterium]
MSGYFVYQSTRLESFPEIYSDLFLQDDPLSVPVHTVVQNSGLGEWLNRYLAGKRGAVMGSRILMPEMALRRFAQGYPTARRLLDSDGESSRGLLFMDGMKLTVYKALEEALKGAEDVFRPIRDYLGTSPDERLWQLSNAAAGIFYHYGMNCLPLVESWERNAPWEGLGHSDAASEAWQRRLWRRIFHEESPYIHLSRVLSKVMEAGESYDGPVGRVILFGSMFLGETGLRFFRHLAEDLEVYHFLLTPSRVYSAGVSENNEVDRPFLRNNGRLSAGFKDLMKTLKPDRIKWVLENPEESGSDTMTLDRLRSSLAKDEPMDGIPGYDGSLVIHDVTGIRREVEVLKDRILEALRDDETLAPTQIGVLAPDIGRYAPYIESVFPSRGSSRENRRDHLPYNLSDLPVRSEAPYPSAFRSLMDLPGSRFGRQTLVELFENPCFAPTSVRPELAESWQRITENLNVRWGVDAEHRSGSGAADSRTGSWEYAFKRLLAGYYFEEGDDDSILPADHSGDSAADDSGLLMYVIRSLDEDFRNLDSRSMGVRDWTLLWESLVERWIVPRRGEAGEEDESDRLRIKGAFRDLTALCDDVGDLADFQDPGLPWSAFGPLMTEMTSPSGGRKGRYLARGVTCASLKPMRAIPFRRIYLLGMNEGAWPGREYLTGFDLREQASGFIDLSREAVDRFAFLETIFSASEHLSIFYAGRDPERGERHAPAAPITELLEHLGSGSEGLILRHPLVPFDAAALSGSGPISTSSHEAFELARSRRAGPSATDSSWFPLPPGDEETVDWHQLVRFLKNPVEYFYRRRLGIPVLWEDAGLDEEDVLEADYLDWWNWRNRTIIEQPELLRHPEDLVAAFRERLTLQGAVSDTPASRLQIQSWLKDAASLSDQLERLESEGLDLGEPFTCRFTTGPADAERDGETDPGIRTAPSPLVSPPGCVPLRITGDVGGLRFLRREDGEDKGVWTLLEFVSGKTVRSIHRIESWTAALLLGAVLGDEAPREVRIFRLSGRDQKARRYYFQPQFVPGGEGGEKVLISEPRRILNHLVKIYRDGCSRPLILYPELGDALAAREKKEDIDSHFARAAASEWLGILGNTFADFSRLRDCRYRRSYLGTPDFSDRGLYDAWIRLYKNGGLL